MSHESDFSTLLKQSKELFTKYSENELDSRWIKSRSVSRLTEALQQAKQDMSLAATSLDIDKFNIAEGKYIETYNELVRMGFTYLSSYMYANLQRSYDVQGGISRCRTDIGYKRADIESLIRKIAKIEEGIAAEGRTIAEYERTIEELADDMRKVKSDPSIVHSNDLPGLSHKLSFSPPGALAQELFTEKLFGKE